MIKTAGFAKAKTLFPSCPWHSVCFVLRPEGSMAKKINLKSLMKVVSENELTEIRGGFGLGAGFCHGLGGPGDNPGCVCDHTVTNQNPQGGGFSYVWYEAKCNPSFDGSFYCTSQKC
jgi:hypothetical protein